MTGSAKNRTGLSRLMHEEDNNYIENKFQLPRTKGVINAHFGTDIALENMDIHTQLLALIRNIEIQAQTHNLASHSVSALDTRLLNYANTLNELSLDNQHKEEKKMRDAQMNLMKDVASLLHKEPSETRTIFRVVGALAAALLLCYFTGGLSMIVTAASQCAASAVAPSVQAIGIAAAGTVGGAAAVWFGTKPFNKPAHTAKFFQPIKKATETFGNTLSEHYIGLEPP